MTDPFAEVRENARRHWQDAPFAFIQAKTDFDKLLDDADALLAARDILIDISEQEEEACGYCNGSGGRYADGGAHYPSENAPVVPCGQCGGYGKVPPADAREIAIAALAALPEHLRGDNDEQSRKA